MLSDAPRLIHRKRSAPLRRGPSHCGWFLVGCGMEIPISPISAEILLSAMLSRITPDREDLIDVFWGDREDGGPLYADKIIHVYVCKLNKNLREFGWELSQLGDKKGYSLRRAVKKQPRRRREYVAEMRV